MYTVKSVDIRSCAKIAAALYGGLALLVVPVGIIGAFISAVRREGTGIGISLLFVLAPVAYALLGFLVGAITAWAYNLVAGWTGGIEIELSNKSSESTSLTQLELK